MNAKALFAAACAGLCLAAGTARAHDSWLSPGRDGKLLELATGNRYPVQEFGPVAASVARARCSDGVVQGPALRAVQEHAQRLDLAPDVDDGAPSPVSCWAELQAVDIELEPRLVQVYLAEIRAPADVRNRWAGLQERRLPWRENYRKFARIELASASALPPGRLAAARQPVGMALEIVVLGSDPVAVGAPLAFQVLREGRPLAGFPVELVSERNPMGVWRETDSQGMLRHRLPFGGRWLLRGTDLRPSATRPDSWESRFVTLALEAR
ncbi:MAG: hypothetical protein K0Q43_3363 [Ramlibacter sp.]|jgi:hypothetical protein|nr:hypothetical protein [Ramlibacter sp.]